MVKKVLLIDDEPDMTELASAVLRLNGFEVEAVNEPAAGLARLREQAFDVVTVDLMMPQVKGLVLVDQIRALPGYAATPLFAISAKHLSDDERKLLLLRRVHFVQKPFSPRQLVQLIRDSLPAA
jgi:CheY-like chemotaxis protein